MKNPKEAFNQDYFESGKFSYYTKEFCFNQYAQMMFPVIEAVKNEANFYRTLELAEGQIKVLDLGCGNGMLLKLLLDAGFDAHGIDVSEYCTKNLCSPILNSRVVCGDFMELHKYFNKDVFDVVVSVHSLEYYNTEEINQIIEESSKVMRNAGRFIVSVFTDQNQSMINDNIYPDPHRLRGLTPANWCVNFVCNDRISMNNISGLVGVGESTLFKMAVHGLIDSENLKELYLIKA